MSSKCFTRLAHPLWLQCFPFFTYLVRRQTPVLPHTCPQASSCIHQSHLCSLPARTPRVHRCANKFTSWSGTQGHLNAEKHRSDHERKTIEFLRLLCKKKDHETGRGRAPGGRNRDFVPGKCFPFWVEVSQGTSSGLLSVFLFFVCLLFVIIMHLQYDLSLTANSSSFL